MIRKNTNNIPRQTYEYNYIGRWTTDGQGGDRNCPFLSKRPEQGNLLTFEQLLMMMMMMMMMIMIMMMMMMMVAMATFPSFQIKNN